MAKIYNRFLPVQLTDWEERLIAVTFLDRKRLDGAKQGLQASSDLVLRWLSGISEEIANELSLEVLIRGDYVGKISIDEPNSGTV